MPTLAKRARLEVYVESLDRKKDAELNLASPKIFDEVDKSVMDGEWDGFHSGFPCSSFSRVRWRDSPGGPLPVRCSARIYGLPGNTPAQQREADEGTLMATRSAWLHEKQVASCRRREVPEVSTLENPPGSEDSGSAWDLPEIKDVLVKTRSSTVEFNTCAYQTKLRRRWFKPARWSGKLENLTSLAKVCNSVVGKANTEAAGAYPEDLTDEIAKRIIETWKRILNLEWLRYQMQQKAKQISELQVKWLSNEDRRRKRLYEESSPTVVNPLSKDPKKCRFESKATEAHEVAPRSRSGTPSREPPELSPWLDPKRLRRP
jgi:site-specific DNA-cytosine methylase